MPQTVSPNSPEACGTGLRRLAAQAAVSPTQFREAMSNLSTAVSVIATDGPAGRAGMTCSSVCSISATPPLVGFGVARDSSINETLKANGVLCVSGLHAGQQEVSNIFAGAGRVPHARRFDHGCWATLATGAPYAADALMALDCELVDVREIGTHSFFIAQVVATATPSAAEPLVYHRRSYATLRPI